MTQKPNIVFVITDDQGYPTLGCHGHPFIQTPNIDSFHKDAVRFEQFHSGTTCAPTRAGLMTGHFCNSTGVWHTIGGRSLLRKDEWTLATALKDSGYATGIFGKWHLGDDYPYRPQDRGFEQVVIHGGGGISQQPDYWGNDYFDDTYMVNGEPKAFKGYCTDVFFDEAFDFIKNNKEKPFFCYLSTNAPHSPFNVAPKYRDLYMEDADTEEYARFLGMITNIDENFGRLRKHLQDLELEENTIVIFMSDNGQTGLGSDMPTKYNAGMRGLKADPYEGGHRIPFIMRWPKGGLHSENTVHELSSYVDFMPTMLDLCGIEVPEGKTFHGESLKPLIKGDRSEKWNERIITTDTQRLAYPLKWRLSCVMKNKWRLVNKTELYNLETDPGQQNNIATDHPEVVSELQAGYEEWWDMCSDQNQDEIPISIGAEAQEVAVLRTHDLRTMSDSHSVYDQSQVRLGTQAHGFWEIYIEKDGEYEFDLRRWPEEAGHEVQSGIEGYDVEVYKEGLHPGSEDTYSGGKALDIQTAALNISGYPELTIPVNPQDVGAVFRIHLKRGNAHLRAIFSSNSWLQMSAYYVYVKLVSKSP